MCRVIALNVSVILWRPGDNLHQLDTSSNGGILTCSHVRTNGQDIKTARGTIGPLNSGDRGNLRVQPFHHDTRPLQGRKIDPNCR